MRSPTLSLVRVFDGQKGEDGQSYSIATEYETILRFAMSGAEDDWAWSPEEFSLSLLDPQQRFINWTGEPYYIETVTDENGTQTDVTRDEPERKILLSINAISISQDNNGAPISSDSFVSLELHNYGLLPDYVKEIFYFDDSSKEISDTENVGLEEQSTQSIELKNRDILKINVKALSKLTIAENETDSLKLELFSLAEGLRDSNLTLKIDAQIGQLNSETESYEYSVSAFFIVRPGISTELAKFSLNARDITAAIDNKKLIFNSDGLTVQNGGFRIQNINGEDVLSADIEGNLFLKGTIEANSGKIGGFYISEDTLTSSNLEGGVVVLNGTQGSITARRLSVYSGQVDGSFSVGGLTFQAPTENSNIIASSDNFSLTSNGSLTVQDANIQGVLSASIIDASTFKKGSISTIDGALIFLQHTPILSIATLQENIDNPNLWKITVTYSPEDFPHELQPGDYLYLQGDGQSFSCIVSEVIEGGFTSFVESYKEPNNLNTFYYIGDSLDKPIIGINGDDASLWNGKLNSKAISIFKLNQEGPNLILGDLTPVGETGHYGLYCDDVILKGRLISSQQDNTIAGIDTSVSNDDDVVFWAGQANDGEKSNAPFRVTKEGAVFASNIQLQYGVLADSIIEGGTIKTATVMGSGENGAGLKFISTAAPGICFYNAGSVEDIREENLTLGISSDSFYTLGDDKDVSAAGEKDNFYRFIKLGANPATVNFRGTSYGVIGDSRYVAIQDGDFKFSTTEDGVPLSSMHLTNEGFSTGSREREKAHMHVSSTDTYLNTETVHMKSRVEFGEKMLYRQVGGNYMLYVYEEAKA